MAAHTYPETGACIDNLLNEFVAHLKEIGEIEEWTRRGKQPGYESKIGYWVHLGNSTLKDLRSGQQPATPRVIDQLSTALGGKIGLSAKQIIDMLQDAAQKDAQALAYNSQNKKVKLHVVSYPPFSGLVASKNEMNEGRGLDQVVIRFLHVSQRDSEPLRERSAAENPEEELSKIGNAVYTCMLDTSDRQHSFKTFHSPVRMSLNAVFITRDNDPTHTIQELQKLLTGGRLSQSPPDPLILRYSAITPKGQVAHHHLRALGFNPLDLGPETVPKSVGNLEETLATRLRLVQEDDPSKVAFVLVDEITALRLVQELANQGGARKSKWSPVLVFPLATDASIRLPLRRKLPSFVVGLATVRNHDKELAEALASGLRMLVVTETETLAAFYSDLYTSVVQDVATCLDGIEKTDPSCHRRIFRLQGEPVSIPTLWNQACGIQFAQYALRLGAREPETLFETLNLPWKHVVERAREMLPEPPEGTESVREGRFRIAFRALTPVTLRPNLELSKSTIDDKYGQDLGRAIVDLSDLGFVGQFLRPFEHLIDPIEVPRLKLAQDIHRKEEVRSGDHQVGREDVRVGFLETYNRARFWKFYRLPFFLPLNAVVLLKDIRRLGLDGYEMEHLQEAISPYSDFTTRPEVMAKVKGLRQRLRFIVLDGGAGSELFLQSSEGFSPEKMHVVTVPEPLSYADELTRECGNDIPVVVIQTMNCLNVLRVLKDPKPPGTLVFDPRNFIRLNPKNPTKLQPAMPEFNLPIAVSRDSPRWIDFFDYAIPRYLKEDQTRLERLVITLKEQTKGILQGHFLTPPEGEPNPWDPANIGDLPEKVAEGTANHFLCLDAPGRRRLSDDWNKILEPIWNALQDEK